MDLGVDGADVLLNMEEVAIGEAVEIVSVDADVGIWGAGG